jgi:rod shape-determining protein MreD
MSIYSNIISNIKYLAPLCTSLIFSIIAIMPIMPKGFESITPLLGVISMSFWIVHRPDTMGWLFVAIIGVFTDILYGSFFGTALIASFTIRLILMRIIHKLELFNIYHSLFYVTLSVTIWLIISLLINILLNMHSTNYYNYIFQCIISIIISPMVIFFQLYLLKKITS